MTRWFSLRQTKSLTAIALSSSLLLLSAAKTPEQQTLDAAKALKPLSDDRWREIAKEQLNEQYEIARGDTLWGVSQRLFGEGNYWPKIWALNGQSIANPHWIRPGQKLVFMPGSGTSLPGIKVADASQAQAEGEPGSATFSDGEAPRSQEWRELPLQSWELAFPTLNTGSQPDPFAKNELKRPNLFLKLVPPLLIRTVESPVKAKLSASSSYSIALSQGDQVFLSPTDDTSLEVGKAYALVGAPRKIKSQRDDREGIVYSLQGQIRVEGQKDGVWYGVIVGSRAVSFREETILIDEPIELPIPDTIAAPEAIAATILLDRSTLSSVTSQHQYAFIDRGSEDGVRPGMIFRAYASKDRASGMSVMAEVQTLADFKVLEVSERFAFALVVSSHDVIDDGDPVTALTDISEFFQKKGRPTQDINLGPVTEENELDSLEENSELSDEEKKNLEQLKQKSPSPMDTETAPPVAPESPPNLEEAPLAPPTEETPAVETPAAEAPPTSSEEVAPPETAPLEESETAPSAPPEEAPEAPPEF